MGWRIRLILIFFLFYSKFNVTSTNYWSLMDERLTKISNTILARLDNLERKITTGFLTIDRENEAVKRSLDEIMNSIRGNGDRNNIEVVRLPRDGMHEPYNQSPPIPSLIQEKIYFEDNLDPTDSSNWKRSDFKEKLKKGSPYDYIKSEAKFNHAQLNGNDTIVIQVRAAVHKKERNAFMQVVLRSPSNLPTGHERMFIHKSWGDGSSNDGYVSFRRGPTSPSSDNNRVHVPRSDPWNSGIMTMTWILRPGGEVEVLENGDTVVHGSIPIAYFTELYDFSMNFSIQFGIKLVNVLVTNSESLAASKRT